jgi:hypothetical protein
VDGLLAGWDSFVEVIGPEPSGAKAQISSGLNGMAGSRALPGAPEVFLSTQPRELSVQPLGRNPNSRPTRGKVEAEPLYSSGFLSQSAS